MSPRMVCMRPVRERLPAAPSRIEPGQGTGQALLWVVLPQLELPPAPLVERRMFRLVPLRCLILSFADVRGNPLVQHTVLLLRRRRRQARPSRFQRPCSAVIAALRGKSKAESNRMHNYIRLYQPIQGLPGRAGLRAATHRAYIFDET